MKESNVPKCDTFSNKVKVDLDVLGALVLNRVCGHVYGTDIVTNENGLCGERSVKLLKESAKPTCFSDSVGDCSVLSLGAEARDGVLSLGGP
jgi:hypothetical protein